MVGVVMNNHKGMKDSAVLNTYQWSVIWLHMSTQ